MKCEALYEHLRIKGQYLTFNMYVIDLPKRREEKSFSQEIFEVLMAKNFPKLINKPRAKKLRNPYSEFEKDRKQNRKTPNKIKPNQTDIHTGISQSNS